MTTTQPHVVIYHYPFSPYARRVIWYLALRGIPYSQCMQPPIMPRPDLSRLGVSYRRIPVLAIGRDIYLDTRLQLPKLEAMFPEIPRLGAQEPDQQAVQQLLSHFTTEGGLFLQAVRLLPTDLPVTKDPKFTRDRADLFGGKSSTKASSSRRHEALGEMARNFRFLETTLLADGRDWILKTNGPSLADIEAVWPFHWLTGLPGALPQEQFSAAVYPRVYAWIRRFQDAVSAAKRRNGAVKSVSGEEAEQLIRGASYSEPEKTMDHSTWATKELGLQRGDAIEVYPTDTGSAHRDLGRLLGIDGDEVVWEAQGEATDRGADGAVRVHAPMHGFRVVKADEHKKEPKL